MATYEFLRVSLRNWELPPLLDKMSPVKRPDRHKYLQSVLGEKVQFMYRSHPYTYVPFGNDGEILIGAIGRQITELKSEGPEMNFAPKELQAWEHANVFINLAEGQQDQLTAFQKNFRVGSPRQLLEAMFHQIERTERPYKATIEYVVNKEEFWTVVKNNEGKITEAAFVFVPPNMFGGRDEWNKTLRKLRDQNAVETTGLNLRNQSGKLHLEGTEIKEIIDAALDGGGEAKLRSGKKVIFSSSQGRKTVSIEDDTHVAHAIKDKIAHLVEKLFKK